MVLKKLNLEIKAKEKVGVCGRTGSGKSTIAMAIGRLIEASEGCIYIDGVNTQHLDLSVLRSAITIVPQDTVLF